MSETKDKEKENAEEEKKTLSLGSKGTLSLKGSGAAPRKQNIAQGRGRTVAVEVRRKRTAPGAPPGPKPTEESSDLRNLTTEEREARIKALREAEEQARIKEQQTHEDQSEKGAEEPAGQKENAPAEDPAKLQRQQELEELQRIQAEELQRREQETRQHKPSGPGGRRDVSLEDQEEEESYRKRMKRTRAPRRSNEDRRRGGKLTVTQVLNEDYARDRGPSLAAQRRAREKARMMQDSQEPPKKQSREVVVPEAITVQELANRMAERAGDVVKVLMNMGVMATINQAIDADTAELIVGEFGHKIKRVTEADIEEGIEGPEDKPEDLVPRPPVVTVMGHVDHGKTSLLDGLRETDVASGEAGGITQHIGAYQITMANGARITFLDTPGHAAFTEMRARGANVTDIVVLVVAANDSLMPQTIEAINHAKAAGVPMIVAINKIDLPEADPQKVKTDLLQHEVIVEDMGGDVLCVEVSALKKMNLDKLEETILLQAELLEIQANPDRAASGAVIEAKLEQGRGNVATVLVQRGTLEIGDIFVVGAEWGRVRAMVDDRGANIEEAVPGQPVEIIGLNGAPEAGDRLVVVEDENKARQITSYRQRKRRDVTAATLAGATSFEDLLLEAREGKKKELAVLIKADVHGSVEAIAGSLQKIEEENDEIGVRILHAGVGGISESDVTLAKASNALIIGFNVRANSQARELAEREDVEIRYYNIIYNVIDDAKAILSGLLAPAIREEYLGQAQIRQVFSVTKIGKVAGCMVTKGVVKRGAGVRLLRDDVVIHEGTLKTLKRFKDEVKEVKEGMECGMAFENYDDIKEGDIIECYEVVEEARKIG